MPLTYKTSLNNMILEANNFLSCDVGVLKKTPPEGGVL